MVSAAQRDHPRLPLAARPASYFSHVRHRAPQAILNQGHWTHSAGQMRWEGDQPLLGETAAWSRNELGHHKALKAQTDKLCVPSTLFRGQRFLENAPRAEHRSPLRRTYVFGN